MLIMKVREGGVDGEERDCEREKRETERERERRERENIAQLTFCRIDLRRLVCQWPCSALFCLTLDTHTHTHTHTHTLTHRRARTVRCLTVASWTVPNR
jgi:hypothetical protein